MLRHLVTTQRTVAFYAKGSAQMFSTIQTAPPDPILGLTEAFKADANPNKINLSVGVYKDPSGTTPVLQCVKEAERRLIDDEATKGYLGIDGLPDYRDHVRRLLLGDSVAADQTAVVQTPGGTGALRLAADFVATQLKGSRVWLSNPSWANHKAIFTAAGVPTEAYSYLNADKTGLDFDAMTSDTFDKTIMNFSIIQNNC